MYFTIAEDIGSEFSVVVGCRFPDAFMSEWGAVGSEEEWRWGGNYSLVCGGGGTLCTGLELEDGRVLLPAPWFPPPFT